MVKKFYPDWIIRVYHDSSILDDIKCELECLKDDQQKLFDNIDFCDIENLQSTRINSWNANYTHSMMWRWFPIGDHLVDAFISRDTDSIIIQREIDSVNVWLSSDKYGHIMRGI